MAPWLKAFVAVLAGFVTWFIVGTVGNVVLRTALPGYQAVEKAMDFSVAMLVARLILAAISSFAGGLGSGWLWRRHMGPGYALAGVLLAVFVPIHIALWSRFPLWYHAVFLLSLAPLTLLGFRLMLRRQGR